MTSNNKVGLWICINQSNNDVLSYEEEMNRTVFKCTEEDFLNKPLYSRFSKTDNFKRVPHPLTRDYTPKQQEGIDDSLYVYGKKGSQKPEIKSIIVPNEMSMSKSVITNEKDVSESNEVEPSCVTHLKTPRQQMNNQETHKVKGKNWNEIMERELGEGYSFIKKKCFVCGSLSHLIKDCDFYEKKMAREAELKKQRVFNIGNGVAKPVWNYANRVNRANHFIPRPVQHNSVRHNINTGRANVNSVKSNVNSVRHNVNTGRENVNSVKSNVNSVKHNVNSFKNNVNTGRSKQPVPISNSNSFSPVRTQGNWGTAVKTSAGYNWRRTRPNSNYNSGSNFVRTVNVKGPQGRPKPEKAWVPKRRTNFSFSVQDHPLQEHRGLRGGSVTFGGSKGYITGKGRIRVGFFIESECLVVSPDFKMPDKNQILLKVPRQHNMYSFDMKTPSLAKDYACLIAKATFDESKLWHRRLGTLPTPNANASEEEDEANELIVVPTTVKHTATKVRPRMTSINTISTAIEEDTPEIIAFRKELDELAQKHLREVPKNKATSTNSVNYGSGQDNPHPGDQDDLDMPELTIFNKPQKGIFDEASY
ncbi:hypothetical protein Tco_0116979, partial [Tanacetum coccineum]